MVFKVIVQRRQTGGFIFKLFSPFARWQWFRPLDRMRRRPHPFFENRRQWRRVVVGAFVDREPGVFGDRLRRFVRFIRFISAIEFLDSAMRAGDEIGLTPKQIVIAGHYASHGQID
jgi:hypothetical protein